MDAKAIPVSAITCPLVPTYPTRCPDVEVVDPDTHVPPTPERTTPDVRMEATFIPESAITVPLVPVYITRSPDIEVVEPDTPPDPPPPFGFIEIITSGTIHTYEYTYNFLLSQMLSKLLFPSAHK